MLNEQNKEDSLKFALEIKKTMSEDELKLFNNGAMQIKNEVDRLAQQVTKVVSDYVTENSAGLHQETRYIIAKRALDYVTRAVDDARIITCARTLYALEKAHETRSVSKTRKTRRSRA